MTQIDEASKPKEGKRIVDVSLKCRFYEKKHPDIDDVVMVKVTRMEDMGAYCILEEYNGKEGMILLSELSRKRIRSVHKLVKIGRTQCVQVIRLDAEKDYIDLSKRRVQPEEAQVCEDKYSKAKTVNSILRHAAALLGFTEHSQLEELAMKTAWFFDRKGKEGYSSYEHFKKAVGNPEILDECEIDFDTKDILLSSIRSRLTPQGVKLRAEVDVACYGYEGIDAVKDALRAGLDQQTETIPLKINLIAPPVYTISVTTTEQEEGLDVLNKAISAIQKSITEVKGGNFNIKLPPKIMTGEDEAELASKLEKLELAGKEVAGDSDDEEEAPGSDDGANNGHGDAED